MFKVLISNTKPLQFTKFLALLFLFFVFPSCAKFKPQSSQDAAFFKRAQTQSQGKVTVSVAALGPKESQKYFGLKLAKKGIQPVWLKIDNQDKIDYWLQAISIDPEYYPPNEVARKNYGGHSKKTQKEIEAFLQNQQLSYAIPPGGTHEGFIYTNLSNGMKDVGVELWGEKVYKRFAFVVPVPGLRADYDYVDWEHLYPPDHVREVSLSELRQDLQNFPCCTTDKKMKEFRGDPINLVIVGDDEDLIAAFTRRGWKQTEIKYKGSIFRTLKSFLFKSSYDNSPVSDLYLLGRHQDIAFQKPRKTIHNRNHLRLWQTPLRYQGKAVWIGGISRDIGVKATLHAPFFVTHVIDSDVDESRDYLLQDFLATNAVGSWGYVTGAGESTPENPRKNFMGDEIFTDGLRLVMILGDIPVPILNVKDLEWEYPPVTLVGNNPGDKNESRPSSDLGDPPKFH